jgi:hypothetical protein
MKRLTFAACAAAIFVTMSTPASARYMIVQWFYGDCKIWFDKGITPLGGGWRTLAGPFPYHAQAHHVLQGFYNRRICY